MANIISIGTATPDFRHPQNEILKFMQQAYNLNDVDKRKLSFLYGHSGIQQRYSVIEDFSKPIGDWSFIPNDHSDAFPCLERRLMLYDEQAAIMSVNAINNCIENIISAGEITHLITVSCTGMSAPGLDLQVCEALNLSPNVFRSSVNFMGCYAAIHAMKIAQMICDTSPAANVVVVCTELCTIHFQKEYTLDNAASSLLFGDGSAAMLISNNQQLQAKLTIKDFHSHVSLKGKNDMSWQLSSKGFLMTLSSYVPQLIQEDIDALVTNALKKSNLKKEDITHWCIHPGGKKIIDLIQKQMNLQCNDVQFSNKVLADYGNMSSATILFVLKEIIDSAGDGPKNVFGVAFGPGLTMETFVASNES